MPKPILPQVKNIVFLMLENRSLDNVLGWLYQGSDPSHVFPRHSQPGYDGLQRDQYTNPDGSGAAIPVRTVPDEVWAKGDAVPYWNPYEMMVKSVATDPRPPWNTWNGVMNQLFGNKDIIKGLPSPHNGPPAMKGFLQDYYADYMVDWKGHDILWTHTPNQLPVINGLASAFAVSDRWFSSVPSQTNPNRAYSICGTSLGRESNQNFLARERFDAPTMFNYLARAGKSWSLYYSEIWLREKSYTEYTFPHISHATGNSEIGDISKFFQRAHDGSLPHFTYLEPKWGGLTSEGNDYHPPSQTQPAEAFLGQVFDAVRSGPQWDETLLIITFDEHGGTYDHVAPPWCAINPDGRNGTENGFGFNLFGVRVPTILVSPFVRPRTVFRAPEESRYPFDHTSFIKTLLLWAGVSDLGMVDLGKRMPHAPTFEGVLADRHVNTEAVELDVPEGSPVAGVGLRPTHPAGSPDELRILLEGLPVVATREILAKAETMDAARAEVERYRDDPEKFEDLLEDDEVL